MTPLESLKIRLGIRTSEEDCQLMLYLEDARAFVLSYTNRTVIPEALRPAWISAAVGMYGRRGMEGESRQTIGDVSRTAEALPADLVKLLNSWRLGRVVPLHARQ
ncbi:hypothetical protein FACS1894184_01190 [Clostridia bacterium]|nr:hypothetical protein FACS1894184_01190 [Clostridia bacterium]